MDAKPQRPVRTVRGRGDENAPALNRAVKTIHQRNKSTPALSTIAGFAGNKEPAKRTAFGDVSNTINTLRSNKDDTSIPSKGALKITEKPICLARPAQRPFHTTGTKAALGNATSVDSNTNPAPLEKSQVKSGRVPTKRNNTVFKDPTLQPVTEEGSQIAPEQAQDPNSNPGTTKDTSNQGIPSKETDPLPATKVAPNKNIAKHAEQASTIRISNEANPVIETVVETKNNAPDRSKIETNTNSKPNVKAVAAEPQEADKIAMKPTTRISRKRPSDPTLTAHSQYDHAQPHSEPEEYWDDDDEDNYDEDGYVTARSNRSRTDNTTSGATMVLFPKATQQVRRELALAKQIVEATTTIEEYEEECWDTTMVAEYGEEIFQYMRELELKLLPNAHYMDNQAEIQWSMRSVLMDWLVQVHHRFSLLPETLFLCVNYIDRFLSCKIVSLGKLQLVGATAIFIAAKYEEINCPSVQEIVYMVDKGYTIDEILKAERYMLSMLQFELGCPGPMSFLRRISKADDYDLETRTLAKYFLEITIMDERFVGSPPSYIAAGAHFLSRMMLRKGEWTPAHVYYSNYTYSQLHPLASLIVECCESPQRHHLAVYEKYADRRFKRASYFVENEIMNGFCLPEAHYGSSSKRQ